MDNKNARELIIKKLTTHLQQYPNIRVGQALINLGILEAKLHSEYAVTISDPYYEDDSSIWQRMLQCVPRKNK